MGARGCPATSARMAPPYGNLFVRSTETTPVGDLKKKLIDMCRQRNKPYGVIVRQDGLSVFGFCRRDPAAIKWRARRQPRGERAGAGLQGIFRWPGGTGARPAVPQLERAIAEGHTAAGDDSNAFDFLNNQAPLALIGGASYVTAASVIAPSVLIDDVEMHPTEEENPKLPIVPAPEVRAEAGGH